MTSRETQAAFDATARRAASKRSAPPNNKTLNAIGALGVAANMPAGPRRDVSSSPPTRDISSQPLNHAERAAQQEAESAALRRRLPKTRDNR